jgi:hypothetical protein
MGACWRYYSNEQSGSGKGPLVESSLAYISTTSRSRALVATAELLLFLFEGLLDEVAEPEVGQMRKQVGAPAFHPGGQGAIYLFTVDSLGGTFLVGPSSSLDPSLAGWTVSDN